MCCLCRRLDEPSPFSSVEWSVRLTVQDVRDDLDFDCGAEVSFGGFVRVNFEACVVPEWLCSNVCCVLGILFAPPLPVCSKALTDVFCSRSVNVCRVERPLAGMYKR